MLRTEHCVRRAVSSGGTRNFGKLADEYDAAQERGEVASKGKPVNVPDGNIKATVEDIGLSRKDVHEARQIRDAEAADPGIVRRTLDEKLASGEEPMKVANVPEKNIRPRRHPSSQQAHHFQSGSGGVPMKNAYPPPPTSDCLARTFMKPG
ncbi:hypothetical protein [Rhizobium binae]|uniref:hypothetical protein n=1 Tax=Rhizobium binae TaxID=1138190 RepID=UPI001C83FFF8|nr:hypothetical protein [Rhizobium binae]MBX4966862.1 hypothetical protein [Rhizobium binae]